MYLKYRTQSFRPVRVGSNEYEALTPRGGRHITVHGKSEEDNQLDYDVERVAIHELVVFGVRTGLFVERHYCWESEEHALSDIHNELFVKKKDDWPYSKSFDRSLNDYAYYKRLPPRTPYTYRSLFQRLVARLFQKVRKLLLIKFNAKARKSKPQTVTCVAHREIGLWLSSSGLEDYEEV